MRAKNSARSDSDRGVTNVGAIIAAMKIILTAVESDLAKSWHRHCGQLAGVSVHVGSILDLKVDAVVSPANSFGFMDGGIDRVYSHHFGWGVQDRLQQAIRNYHHGELLVGNAEVVETDDANIPYLIAAPTMRVPTILKETVNPYLAARAIFLLIRHGTFRSGVLAGEPIRHGITSIAIPGLGTGVGRVDPDTCALQVRTAIEQFVVGSCDFPLSWADAQIRHQKLYADRIRDLQLPTTDHPQR